jgi:Na+/pantothenate symporter
VKTNTDAKKGLKKAILYFTLIWSTLVICSTLFFNSEILLKHFDPNQLTLSDYLITYLYHGGVLQNFILAIVFAGLLAAMITTSDSILIIISQMILFRLVGNSDEKKNITVKQIRLSMFAIGLFSFLIFSVFSYFNYDVVDLIFSIYGAQLALFFPVLISLYLKKEDILPKISKYVQCAILLGFLSGWASAIYGAKLGGDSVWLYNAGVVSFFVSGIIILFGYLKNKKFV